MTVLQIDREATADGCLRRLEQRHDGWQLWMIMEAFGEFLTYEGPPPDCITVARLALTKDTNNE